MQLNRKKTGCGVVGNPWTGLMRLADATDLVLPTLIIERIPRRLLVRNGLASMTGTVVAVADVTAVLRHRTAKNIGIASLWFQKLTCNVRGRDSFSNRIQSRSSLLEYSKSDTG